MNPRPSRQDALDQLAKALSGDNVKREIRDIVLSLFTDKYVEFVQIALQEGAACMSKDSIILEPSDLFLEVISALRTNDTDKSSSSAAIE